MLERIFLELLMLFRVLSGRNFNISLENIIIATLTTKGSYGG
jgi:hypothetical protein